MTEILAQYGQYIFSIFVIMIRFAFFIHLMILVAGALKSLPVTQELKEDLQCNGICSALEIPEIVLYVLGMEGSDVPSFRREYTMSFTLRWRILQNKWLVKENRRYWRSNWRFHRCKWWNPRLRVIKRHLMLLKILMAWMILAGLRVFAFPYRGQKCKDLPFKL